MPRPPTAPLLALGALLTLAGAALAAAPVGPGDADRLTSARAALETALAALAAPEPPPGVRAVAEGALGRIEALVDSYHHAPNLRRPDARPHVLAMRRPVGRLFAPDGPLVLRDDVIHPKASVSAALAGAARREGDRGAEIHWLRAALATEPEAASHLGALRDAYLATGDVAAANTISIRLKAAAGGGAVSAPR